MFGKVGRFFRTIYYLKLSQIFYRLKLGLLKPNLSTKALPNHIKSNGLLVSPVEKKPTMIGPLRWNFLNIDGCYHDLGWQDARRSKLWRYNQHYFDDLNAKGSRERQAWHKELITRWIVENPPLHGCGWEPYPTSLRIVNWIKWTSRENVLSTHELESLSLQSRYLAMRIERHLLGNHLLANAKALVHSGLFFEGEEADKWLNLGFNILKVEISEQILGDGGHFELSPMYHALVTEDLLDLINICGANLDKLSVEQIEQYYFWRKTINKMLSWLDAVSHPDNKISFFNDAAFGIAAENEEIFLYAHRLGHEVKRASNGITNLETSGLVRLQTDDAILIADLGNIGPDYLPGHSHADTLSFEMSLFGQRIFVNSGTSEYSAGVERLRQRGTAAHNTVCIDDQNSSEVWSSFRVGSRAKILSKQEFATKNQLVVSATHNGYSKIFKKQIHERVFIMECNKLVIRDIVTKKAKSKAYYYLGPQIKSKLLGTSHGIIETKDGLTFNWSFEGVDNVKLVESTWHPEFGKSIKNNCLVASFTNLQCDFSLAW